MINIQTITNGQRLINGQRFIHGQRLISSQGLISDYLQKINNYLDFDTQCNSQPIQYNQNDSVILQIQIKKSTEYLQTLRKNSYKIEQLIIQNDSMRKQIDLQRKTILIHLKKQIQLKYTISTLQEELQIAHQQIISLQTLAIKQTNSHQQSSLKGLTTKQVYKLQEKLQNCIQQNQILRQQNQAFRKVQFTKEQNYLQIETQFKLNLTALSQQVQSLKTDLHYQTEKAILLDKIQAQNMILKTQNKRLQSMMDTKLLQYESHISSLLQQLNHLRQGKQIFKEKYEQLTDIITIVDQMRLQFKTKKKSLQYNQQSSDLLKPIQLTTNYPLLTKTKSIDSKKTQNKSLKKQNNP